MSRKYEDLLLTLGANQLQKIRDGGDKLALADSQIERVLEEATLVEEPPGIYIPPAGSIIDINAIPGYVGTVYDISRLTPVTGPVGQVKSCKKDVDADGIFTTLYRYSDGKLAADPVKDATYQYGSIFLMDKNGLVLSATNCGVAGKAVSILSAIGSEPVYLMMSSNNGLCSNMVSRQLQKLIRLSIIMGLFVTLAVMGGCTSLQKMFSIRAEEWTIVDGCMVKVSGIKLFGKDTLRDKVTIDENCVIEIQEDIKQ